MKINLLSILLLASSAGGAEILFKDGTKIQADIHDPKPEGVILMVGEKVYLHHYPFNKEAPAPPDYNSKDNPVSLPSCVPMRVSFFYLSQKTQDELSERYKKAGTEKAIGIAYGIEKDKYKTVEDLKLVPSQEKTRNWQTKALIEFHFPIDTQKVIWGKFLK